MYGSGGSGSLRRQEQERQARINEGLGRINATFDGSRGTGLAASYAPGQVYYDQWGQVWNPQPSGGEYPYATKSEGRRGADNLRRRVTPEEYRASQFGNQQLFTGKENVGGFDDSFYANREKDYLGYALPQFERQNAQADRNLTYSLARAGLLDSTAGRAKQTDLGIYAGQKRREIADAAAGSANDLRRTVEGQRANLVAQLEASGDADATAQLALNTANAYRAPSAFQPIGNFFEDWTRNYAANQQARAYDDTVQPLFNFGSNSKSSLSTVR